MKWESSWLCLRMAVLNHISLRLTSTTATISQEQPTSNPRPTKVILPKKKPLKWSTGLAPGDYGGPPATTKLRKYWGGEEDDPLTSDDFIWNKDFVGRMKKLIQDPASEDSTLQSSPVKLHFCFFFPFNCLLLTMGFFSFVNIYAFFCVFVIWYPNYVYLCWSDKFIVIGSDYYLILLILYVI